MRRNLKTILAFGIIICLAIVIEILNAIDVRNSATNDYTPEMEEIFIFMVKFMARLITTIKKSKFGENITKTVIAICLLNCHTILRNF